MNPNPIPIIILTPIIAGLLSWLTKQKKIRKAISLIGGTIPLIYLTYLYPKINEEQIILTGKILELNIGFSLYKISWIFASLIALIGFASILGMISTVKSRYEWLFSLMSLTGALGIFLSFDLISFFIFWEVMTFGSFMMILRNNKKSSMKYILMSLIGAYSMLMGIGLIYANTGNLLFSSVVQSLPFIPNNQLPVIFGLFAIAFGVKAGMFPLHVWAPNAYSGTDQSYTAFFSGGLSKTGVYGFTLLQILAGGKILFEFNLFSNVGDLGYVIAFLGGITIVVGGTLAALQQDIRKLFAYSSVSQVGYIVMGLGVGTVLSVQASIFHAISHALFKGLFFLTISAIIYRTGKTKFKDMGGLAEKMPYTFAMSFIAILSLAGIPPMVGFASKWVLFESIISEDLPILGAFAFYGSAIGFVYLIRYIYAVWFGQRPTDLDYTKFTTVPLAAGMTVLGLLNVVFGVAPGLVAGELNSMFGREVIGGSLFMLDVGFGQYNALLLTIYLVVGLGVAALIYFVGAKVKRVPITDNYQSGNPITMEYNMNIGRNFFLPLEEVIEPLLDLSFDDNYRYLAELVEEIAEVLRSHLYNGDVQRYAWYLVIVLFIIALWGL